MFPKELECDDPYKAAARGTLYNKWIVRFRESWKNGLKPDYEWMKVVADVRVMLQQEYQWPHAVDADVDYRGFVLSITYGKDWQLDKMWIPATATFCFPCISETNLVLKARRFMKQMSTAESISNVGYEP